MCLSFSTSVGKLHLLASPQIHSMSSSGVLPALILISSSWYILHYWDTGWSMELCRNSIKSLALFLFFSHSSLQLYQRGSTACASFIQWDPRNWADTPVVWYHQPCQVYLGACTNSPCPWWRAKNLQTVPMSSSWRLEVLGNLSVNPWYPSKPFVI